MTRAPHGEFRKLAFYYERQNEYLSRPADSSRLVFGHLFAGRRRRQRLLSATRGRKSSVAKCNKKRISSRLNWIFPLQPILCEATYILLEYARTAMFMWMFIEGFFLHNMVTGEQSLTLPILNARGYWLEQVPPRKFTYNFISVDRLEPARIGILFFH